MAARTSVELKHIGPIASIDTSIAAPPRSAARLDTTTPDDSALESSPPGTPTNGPVDGQQYSELPPVDRGKGAYMFLVCCFTIETLVWGEFIKMAAPPPVASRGHPTHHLLRIGFPFSFGIFQDYYRTLPDFAGAGNIAVIGTCAMVCFTPS